MCKELEKCWLPFLSCQLHVIFAQLDSVIFILTTPNASLSNARCGALSLSLLSIFNSYPYLRPLFHKQPYSIV
jgi:hypothetical protein